MKTGIYWLFPGVRRKVLALLLGRPEERWHLRNISRQTGLAIGTVRREVEGLVQAEIARKIKEGNRTYYQADTECPLFPELSGLIRKTVGLADVVGQALAPLEAKIDVAFIYGSQASGEATGRSDVDLLVVGDLDEMTLHNAIGKAEEELGRAVNYTLLSRNEFENRRKEKAGFLARVLAGQRIALVGDVHEV